MSRRPESGEFAAYYATYVNRVPHDDVLTVLAEQLRTVPQALHGISEEKSLHRYAPGKWSIRELLHHVNDCERVFAFRALWFARGFDSALPGFDENAGAVAAQPQRPGRVERHPLAGGRKRREPGVQPGRSGKGRSGVRRSTHGALPQTWSSACASRALSCRRSNWLTMSLGAAPRSPACQPTNACSMCAWMRA